MLTVQEGTHLPLRCRQRALRLVRLKRFFGAMCCGYMRKCCNRGADPLYAVEGGRNAPFFILKS